MIAKNKKGFEMSINTIVILVIAVTMLILGIVLVKTIMCGAMNLAASTNEGAQAQINKLFSEEKGEIVSCMGINSPLDAIPGKYNVIGCGFSAKIQKSYPYTYTLVSARDIDGNNITADAKFWIIESQDGIIKGNITVYPGQIGYGTFTLRPSDDAPESILIFDLNAQGVSTQKIKINIKRVGFVQNSIC